MKKFRLLFFIMLSAVAMPLMADNESDAQQIVADDDKVYNSVDVMPQYPGGTRKMMEKISANIRYPEELVKAGVQGTVFVSFVVTKTGQVEGAKVMKSVHPDLDAEALRLVNAMPKWTPGTVGNKPVNTKITVPIIFKVWSDDDEKAETTDKTKISSKESKTSDEPNLANAKKMSVKEFYKLKADDLASVKVDKANNRIISTMHDGTVIVVSLSEVKESLK